MSSFKKPFALAAQQAGNSPPERSPGADLPKRVAITIHSDETRLPVLLIAPTIH
jgi:hypothetical protein